MLLLGGRAGVGKSTVAFEVSHALRAAGVAHCLLDGDALDAAWPTAPDDPHGTALTEANLAALWANYAAIGHSRAVYVNTVSVLEAGMVVRAMGGASARGVLLTASDATARERLAVREVGSGLQEHVERSAAAARRLDAEAPDWVVRVATDGRTVAEVAADVVAVTGWAAPQGL